MLRRRNIATTLTIQISSSSLSLKTTTLQPQLGYHSITLSISLSSLSPPTYLPLRLPQTTWAYNGQTDLSTFLRLSFGRSEYAQQPSRILLALIYCGTQTGSRRPHYEKLESKTLLLRLLSLLLRLLIPVAMLSPAPAPSPPQKVIGI